MSPTPATAETRRDALLASLPTGSAFSVELPMGPRTLLTALHLPKDGEGTWYVEMRGTLMVIPAENITWDGTSFRFDMKLVLGPINNDVVVSGEVGADGTIPGTFEAPAGGFSPFQGFEGMLAGAGN